MQHQPMYMRDWVMELDDFAKRYGKGVLSNVGTISHHAALEKANTEYEKYRQKTMDELSPFSRTLKTPKRKLKEK